MAGNAKNKRKVKGYIIKVKNRPNYNGVGAGGVQFAYGQATIEGGTIVDWYKEHAGYEVNEILEDEEPDTEGDKTN